MGISAAIFGCSEKTLTQQEREFYNRVQPWGFILFGRNIETPDQVAGLVSDLKSCVDHEEVPVLIDQEGGRVRRLRPPHWAEYHSGSLIGQHYMEDREKGLRIAWLQSRLMAFDLQRLGINVDCLPVLDVPVPGSHDVIGDRAYGNRPEIVSDIGRAASYGLLDGGVSPVIKHIPGHGRACADSHKELPKVSASLKELKSKDFVPFKSLCDMPMAMTAHVVYEAIDSESPATSSKTVIDEIIRGFMEFEGLLMCDDLSMNALSGDFSHRTQSAFAAGCDIVLHCNGTMEEMLEVSGALQDLEGVSATRANAAMERLHSIDNSNENELRKEFETLCAGNEYQTDPTEAVQWAKI
ncbi:MAG: beta-N-acetylhexosaminidase [Rhizobiaceae bacterium]